MTNSPYFDQIDFTEFAHEYPNSPEFLERYAGMPRKRLIEIQEAKFARVIKSGWQIPLYQRLWSEAGVKPSDINSLQDIEKLPIIDKTMILEDVAEFPPFGSLGTHPGNGADRNSRSRILQTTSGTTGTAQPVIWGAWGREVQNLLLGRTYRWLGITNSDVVHSVYGHGLINGGHYIREAITRYTEATFISAGTGTETRSERQIEVLQRFGATVLVGFSDYLLRLAEVAQGMGIDPNHDLKVKRIIGHLPAGGREKLEAAWGGAKAYNWYGVADTGILATEGPERDGLYIWEDANIVEVIEQDSHQSLPDGSIGDLVVTSLAKHDLAPLIRFNTHDLTAIESTRGAADLPFARMQGFLGRSDNMVKLRGINIYPTGLSALLMDIPGFTGEYFARLERNSQGMDHLVVVTETSSPTEDVRHLIENHLTRELGVKIGAEVLLPGATAEATQLTTRQKPIRLIDVRSEQ